VRHGAWPIVTIKYNTPMPANGRKLIMKKPSVTMIMKRESYIASR